MNHSHSTAVSGVSSQLKRLNGRDFELQTIAVLITTALLFGLLAFIACNGGGNSALSSSLPQLVAGLVALLVLLTAYLVSQKRTLHRATDLLIQQVLSESIVQKYSFIDETTHLFTREYLDHAIAHELIRAHQHGSPLTFMLVKAHVSGANTDTYVTDAAQLLRSTFRGSDTLIRFDHHDFLVILSETGEQGAQIAARRLTDKVDQWNVSADHAVELAMNYTLHAYSPANPRALTVDDLAREFGRMHDVDARTEIAQMTLVRPPVPIVH